MSDLVPAEDIERIVGVPRHPTAHYGRAVSSEQTVYVLHSKACKDSGIDLRDCEFSRWHWTRESTSSSGTVARNMPVELAVDDDGLLVPAGR